MDVRGSGSRRKGPVGAWGGQETVSRTRLKLVREEVVEDGGAVVGADPAALAAFLWRRLFHDEPREVVAVAFLDGRKRLTGYMAAFAGTLTRAAVEPRQILAAALLYRAPAVVIAHNHPSGSPEPSAEDHLFSRRLEEAGRLVGVELVDHIIVGSPEDWVSLREKGGVGEPVRRQRRRA
jgi:DNA repair protein RadC